ncbi:MAG: AAA family ATPase [Actinobacteria bacterium 69-20]|nr:ATP-binding protein [Actinomycetota bacterium]OJV24937.1 MAG: AAA family ATPase [Actinobacteria bacterium 69-20]
MAYLPRVVDRQLDRLLAGLPAVAIEGPKAVGKTVTARRRVVATIALDDDAERVFLRDDPQRLDRLDKPLLIDEWQHYPPVWDRVRHDVDAGAGPGTYLLAGSNFPAEAPQHSGAGRIVTVRMRPLSLTERQIATPTVSLEAMLAGSADIAGDCVLGLQDYTEEITRSGFPGIRALADDVRPDILDGYLATVVDRDFAEAGRPVRRPQTLRAWLAAYAAATSTTAAYNVILDAATPGLSDKPSRATTIAYREILQRMWLLEELPTWAGSRNWLTALGQAPKHHLADPALAARLLGVTSRSLLSRPDPGSVSIPRDGTLLGALFESLVTLSVRVYADALRATVSHLRTQRGDHEVDLIVTGDDGAAVALEVKLGAAPDDRDVRHLLWLKERMGGDLADAAVITTGGAAYRRPDGIAVVPAALLGP